MILFGGDAFIVYDNFILSAWFETIFAYNWSKVSFSMHFIQGVILFILSIHPGGTLIWEGTFIWKCRVFLEHESSLSILVTYISRDEFKVKSSLTFYPSFFYHPKKNSLKYRTYAITGRRHYSKNIFLPSNCHLQNSFQLEN